ncbi:LytTR family transcriptional regulator [Paenibacillus alvei]|uniref:LytTR family transcriptional regulator n=1 Tax=Paenibacillus alvei TaxID=44250 RepID=A0ABT4E625_PAEAL|nr:LytTR family DNA-binding domain-containing protein [Paenibacillus alvei]MCY9529184.1 LytTR family transcriptional regulator [Paenibacillus alvei]
MELNGIDANIGIVEVEKFNLLEDVLWIAVDGKLPRFYTAEKSFYQVVTMEELRIWLHPFGFRLLDRVNLVNTNKITRLDDGNRTVWFNGKHVTVSRRNLKNIQEALKKRKQ